MVQHFKQHKRCSIRLKHYDYTASGYYFVTMCAYKRVHLFGQVDSSGMHINQFGQIVCEEWNRSALLRPEIILDSFVVMPDHVHGIVIITSNQGDPPIVEAYGHTPPFASSIVEAYGHTPNDPIPKANPSISTARTKTTSGPLSPRRSLRRMAIRPNDPLHFAPLRDHWGRWYVRLRAR